MNKKINKLLHCVLLSDIIFVFFSSSCKVEGEILTLRQVLTAKVRQATELKRKLGITPMQEFKQDIQAGFQQLRESGT